ncbi:dimethylamine monooxygenase subunit DmmA family protein [Komagataeibacter swingsii]|uniref:Dimethylamine monooxygenase subunit DmmA-like C-terminal domain-containing protein n=1 Tax=Komagataeibacter swingsii TaxID=215220 RepID=A0A2V4R178_9PROT|nr:dimethylamine monooxygenase subunit DmmA family protein [Komagataeibacter swingsii]PYD70601.1 hypothetical protein CFR76_04405 [Komagataeibacter swingsii]GBQ58932.1 hypothetical protein AA16373_1413 [Komagataeibacter swingsii DSM 16373]
MTGTRHLFIRQDPDCPLPDGGVPAAFAIWTVRRQCDVLPDGQAREGFFRSVSHMLEQLACRLETERVGLRVYAAGSIQFMGDVARVTDGAGLGAAEVFLDTPRSPARRVMCIHCDTMHENVTRDELTCHGCRAALSVRTHFSRRIGAYMAVSETGAC